MTLELEYVKVALLVVLIGMYGYDLLKRHSFAPKGKVGPDPKDKIELAAVPDRTRPRSRPVELVTAPPMVGSDTLRDWLIHYHRRDGVWAEVVEEFYTRAAGVPEVASYFATANMARLKSHFTHALVIVTHQGITRSTLRMLRDKHSQVRDERGRPIDGAIYDAVVSTLVGVLVKYRVPDAAIEALGRTIAPVRAEIVVVGARHELFDRT